MRKSLDLLSKSCSMGIDGIRILHKTPICIHTLLLLVRDFKETIYIAPVGIAISRLNFVVMMSIYRWNHRND